MSSNPLLHALKIELLEGMRSYMTEVAADGGDAGYVQEDIDRCGIILDTFLADIDLTSQGDEAAVMAATERTIKSLNGLSERCEGMIETEQREQICELIIRAAHGVGVGDGQNDITEQWREFWSPLVLS